MTARACTINSWAVSLVMPPRAGWHLSNNEDMHLHMMQGAGIEPIIAPAHMHCSSFGSRHQLRSARAGWQLQCGGGGRCGR